MLSNRTLWKSKVPAESCTSPLVGTNTHPSEYFVVAYHLLFLNLHVEFLADILWQCLGLSIFDALDLRLVTVTDRSAVPG